MITYMVGRTFSLFYYVEGEGRMLSYREGGRGALLSTYYV